MSIPPLYVGGFRLIPTFVGVLREKIQTRASLKKQTANYISEESLLNVVYDNLSEVFYEVSGATKAWNDWGFSYWIYRLSDALWNGKPIEQQVLQASKTID